jgi:3-methyladenine DNA glycosylase AlkD
MPASAVQAPAPRAAAREILALLASRADPLRATEVQRYFKATVAAFGIPLPEVRRAVAGLHRAVSASWTVNDAVAFCDALIHDPHLEAKAVGLELLRRFEKDLAPEHLPLLHEWLASSAGNWATVDEVAPHLVGPLLDRHPELLPEIVAWTGSPILWVRRAAAVSLVLHARRGKHLDTAYEVATRLLGDREDLAHKAVGWLLREAGRTDRARLTRYLLAYGPRIPRTALRYAIEHFPPRDRKRLMETTRG